ncbi:MAG: AI-2E family transporter [Aquabacterium sp.]|nr:AI-2E family transporter [Aquabacterium sp.]
MPPLLLALSALALGWILLPFYGAILWAIIIAVLFVPIYRILLSRLRQHRNIAAGLVMLLVLVVGVLPFALVTASLAREASVVYQLIESGEWNPALYLRGLFDALPAWLAALLEHAGIADFEHLQRLLTNALAQGSQFIATQAFGIGINTFGFVASLGVTLYLAFFLIRDGDELARIAELALPLPQQFKPELVAKFMAVVRATVKGSLLIACIQGVLGGLAFWLLGIKGALLWAVVMACLSMLPMIGAGLVWLPVAAYFFITGGVWQALALVAYGIFVIGLADNLLRPMLVGKDAGMPDFVVMITTLGGLAVFGINGFIIGPTIAAMFIAVWHLWIAERTRTF